MSEFPVRDYKAMLYSRHQVALMGMPGMEPWNIDKAARLLAILQVFGNNEGFTLSPPFNADREYIQDIYGLSGGNVPNADLSAALRRWVAIYEGVKERTDPVFVEARQWIKDKYGFELYV